MVKNKPMSRIFCVLMSLCMAVSAIFCFPFIKANADTEPNVKLYYAQKGVPNAASNAGYSGCIAVRNLGYQKNVTVHYTDNGSTQHDVSTQYLKNDPENSDYDVWQFDLFEPSSSLTFAIKYEVNGETYWDNNGGKNYTVSLTEPIVLSKCVLKTTQTYKTSQSPMYIYLKNLSYQKTVTVRYTMDNWSTYKSANATYERSLSGNDVEQWNLPANLPHGTNVKYEVRCTMNGVTYIDNNFGYYYTNY